MLKWQSWGAEMKVGHRGGLIVAVIHRDPPKGDAPRRWHWSIEMLPVMRIRKQLCGAVANEAMAKRKAESAWVWWMNRIA